jgi:hypothetical protein
MVEVRFSSKTGVRCAWQNCRESIETGSGEPVQLPLGWRMLVISSGSTSGSKNIMTAGVNAALCPDHVKELYGMLNSEMVALTIHEAQKPHKK